MRKTIVLLATLGLAVILASGLALAAPKGGTTLTRIDCKEGASSCQGTGGPDEIHGTPSTDVIIPYAGDDIVHAYGANDEVRHSFGNDTIYGGEGSDTLRGGFDNDVIWGGLDDDLIDCAYVKPRGKGEAWDTAHATSGDTVVDCLDVVYDDTTS
jgi:Ca2+-binding RTX toxin-like protein